jgi:hypothetical protein
MVMVAKTGSVGAAVATVAKAVADNNRNCEGRQESTKWGSGSGGYSSCGSVNCGSADLTAGRGSCTAEVAMMRTASTVTTAVVNSSS